MMDKKKLKSTLLEIIQFKLYELHKAIALIDQSAKEATKSSAGDKYETSRAMLQQEKDKKQSQMDLWQSHLSHAKLISVESCETVEMGAVVDSTMSLLYISVPVGKFSFQGQKVFGISTDAPIYQAIKGGKDGDQFTFNGKRVDIKKVY